MPQPPRRKAPGILRLLPETLPFYPFCQTNGRVHSNPRKRKQKNADDDAERDYARNINPNASLDQNNNDNGAGFTLFFFVDATNRQSLTAIPMVSKWFHHALNNYDNNDESSGNRIICIPNHPSPREINLRNSNSDPIVQASINSSATTSVAKEQVVLSMLLNTGFYHLPFLHPKRLFLLHLLGATRVPSVIVVSNGNGRIVTRYGWEAINREGGMLEQWIESNWIENKKGDGDNEHDGQDEEGGSTSHFESQVVTAWSDGKSGLPLWWHLLGWIL